jgi:hypothetical protein
MPINPITLPASPTIEKARAGVADLAIETMKRAQLGSVEKSEIAKSPRTALIVAGVSYPRPSQGNILHPDKHRTYFLLALNYKTYLLATGIVDRVVILDFLPGKLLSFTKGGSKNGDAQQPKREPIRVINYRYDASGTLTHKAPSKEARQLYYTGIDEFALQTAGSENAEVAKKDYDPWTGAKENSMSVSDLYGLIRFGLAGSIKEVHFIGHAWLGGPIIVNTPPYRTKKYDKDCRIADFSNTDLKHVFDTGLPLFRTNLAADAIFTIWGCENNREARVLILQARAKEAANQSIENELNGLKGLIQGTYAAHLAKTSGRQVYGALPGTYSVHEGESNDDASGIAFTPTVMHVNIEKCEHILQFYKKYLGARFPTSGAFKGHPTFGRGYAIFNP